MSTEPLYLSEAIVICHDCLLKLTGSGGRPPGPLTVVCYSLQASILESNQTLLCHHPTQLIPVMPPTQSKSTLCLCKTHGCADADCTSTITSQILKGRYLGFTEFCAHQQDENSAKHSECNRQSDDASVEPHCSLKTGQLITFSSLSPISPTLAASESIPGNMDTDILPRPTANVEHHQWDEDKGSCPSNPADQCIALTNK
jgi:hypothetical protein